MHTFPIPVPLLVLAIVLIAAFAILAALKHLKRDAAGEATADYELRPAILTPAERSFYGALEAAVPSDLIILPKIRLADLVTTKSGLPPAHRAKAFNQIAAKHVDFLLVRKTDFVPVAAIELNDASHQRTRTRARDAFVTHVFQSTHLPFLQVPAQATYSINDLRQELVSALGR